MHVSRSHPRTNAQTFTQVSGVRPWNFAKIYYGSLRKFWRTRFFSFTVFRGSNGIQVVFRSSLHFGTPENRHYNAFFIFSQTSCRCITQQTAPQNFVVKRVQLMLELSSSRRRRPKTAIFILKSSNLRVHRGTAKFIALIGKISRCFKELGAELLHRCSMGHYAKSYGGLFSIFQFIFDLEGSEFRGKCTN